MRAPRKKIRLTAARERRRCVSLGVTLTLIVSVVGVNSFLIANSAFASGWVPTAAPLPANANSNPNARSFGTACPAMGSCTAVGQYMDTSSDGQGFIETLSGGTSWSGIEAPQPANSNNTQSALYSVACTSASSCTAVGAYLDTSSHDQGLTDTLAGGTWIPTEAPLPTNASGGVAGLLSITCASAGACIAAGIYADTSNHVQGLLETRSGGVWSGTEAPMPTNANASPEPITSSVACASAGACAVAGYYNDASGNQRGFIDTLSGGTWSSAEAPLPADANASPHVVPGGVTCAAVGACTTVGYYTDTSSHQRGFIDTLSGGTWSGIEAPLPANANSSPAVGLESLACTSVGACTGFGNYNDTAGNSQGFVETLSGGNWSSVEAPLPANANSNPAVSSINNFGGFPRDLLTCSGAGSCTAVGTYTDISGNTDGLIETLSGGIWSPVEAPLPANANTSASIELLGVACAPGNACAAVGTYIDASSHYEGLLETLSPLPPPPPCPGGFAITASSPLPGATQGAFYSTPISACGGTLPYKFGKGGRFPRGLKLSRTGVISGTPTKTGTYTFTVKLKDRAKPKHTASKKFSITVARQLTPPPSTILTIDRVGGPHVSVGDVLQAPVSVSGDVTCSSGSMSATVTSNPPAPGSSGLSITSASVSSCSVGGNPGTASFNNLPYVGAVSDASGLPVAINNVSITGTVRAFSQTCTYTANLNGSASNTTNTLTFQNQSFGLQSGTSFCTSTASVSISIGPLTDTSISNQPLVFVN